MFQDGGDLYCEGVILASFEIPGQAKESLVSLPSVRSILFSREG